MTGLGVGWAGWAHLAFFGVVIPWAAWHSRGRMERHELPPRERHFVAVLIQLLVFLAISVAVARAEGIELVTAPREGWLAWLLAGALLAGGMLLMAPSWRREIERRERKLYLYMPRTPRERMLWVALAAAAGVSEEVTYRGVMYAVLVAMTGSGWAAAGIASLVFGVSHSLQGWKSAGIISLVALLLHGLVAVSGTLFLVIAIHALYDIAAGLWCGRLGEKMGYPIEGIPPDDARPDSASGVAPEPSGSESGS